MAELYDLIVSFVVACSLLGVGVWFAYLVELVLDDLRCR